MKLKFIKTFENFSIKNEIFDLYPSDIKNDFGRDYGLAIGSMFYDLANKK